jgi:hypothetical protein
MSCDIVQAELSVRLDGAGTEDRRIDEHLSGCATCQRFQATILEVRRRLRITAVGPVPDVAGSVRQRIAATPRSHRSWTIANVAAAFVVAVVISAGLTWVVGGSDDAVAAIPERVLTAQRDLRSLHAELSVVERGWHPRVPERRFSGALSYVAPESLALRLRDDTTYPDAAWRPNDIDVVVHDSVAWTEGRRACPVAALPRCTPDAREVRAVTGREPFAEVGPVPLDLAVPVTTFRHAVADDAVAGEVDGREALTVSIPAGQGQPLLAPFFETGNLREVHPADLVRLSLDADALVPLRIVVSASGDADRARWGAARGYADTPGLTILDIRLQSVAVDGSLPADAFGSPPGTEVLDGGFVDGGEVDWIPVPTALPRGLGPHRAGTIVASGAPHIGVRSWSDGREWLKVRAVQGWSEQRLFGGLGDGARPIALSTGGTAYLDAAGSAVALHGDTIDLVVTGSGSLDDLLAVAGSLGVTGRPVPSDWMEATSVVLDDARAALPGLLLPSSLPGFAEPVLRVDDGFVTALYAGPGARSFTLTQGPGPKLAPPIDPDVRDIRVRTTSGRWSPDRGELEWREDGRVLSLRSLTLGLPELLDIARRLQGT